MQVLPSSDSAPALRASILEAARELLLDGGVAALSMRRIASRVGCSATALYLHFDSKDALLHALIEEGLSLLYEELNRVGRLHESPRKRLRVQCKAYINFGLAHPAYYEVMFLLHPRHMQRYPADKYREARRNLDVLSETLTHLGVSDPRLGAQLAWATLHGLVSLLLTHRIDVRIQPEVLIETTLNTLCATLCAASPTPSTP